MLSNCPNCGAITRLISKYCPECGHTLSRSTTPLESAKQSTVVPQNLAPGLILKDRYRIVKPVGIGGAGVVYRGWDTILQIPCAIRVELESMDRESQEQFTRKISCLAQLSHPGLPHIWDHFSCPGQGLYQVMTYINGYNLQTVIDSTNKPLGEKIVLPWIIQICEVLEYIHAQEPALLHRNIKPRHIYITQGSIHSQAVLSGFGIASFAGKPVPKRAQAVTSGFSPPEQYGLIEDARIDVFGIGATLYYLLTNKVPPDSLERKHASKPLVPPRSYNPEMDISLEKHIMKALELEPSNRFQSIHEMKCAIAGSIKIPSHSLLSDIQSMDLEERSSAPLSKRSDEEIALLKYQLQKKKEILIDLQKQEANFYDPRAVPFDLLENIRLINEDINRKQKRLKLLTRNIE